MDTNLQNETLYISCDAHESHRTLPVNYAPSDAKLFSHEITKTIPSCHARVELSVSIVDNHLFASWGSGSLSKYSNSSTAGRRDKIWKYLKKIQILIPPKIVSRGIWVIDDWSAGYFHWLTDALTRVELVNKYCDQYPILLPSHYKSIGYIISSLEILGIPYIYIEQNGRCRVQDLILTSYTAPTGNYNYTLLNRLASRFRNWASQKSGRTDTSKKDRRIYVSRALALRRRITNEDEIARIFKEHGFEILYSEDMSFEAQVELYSTASILAGLHGAGLTNMLFMPSGSDVVEIRRESDCHNNCYFSMASDLSHNYYYLLAKPNSDDLNAGDCNLDTEGVRLLLSTLPTRKEK